MPKVVRRVSASGEAESLDELLRRFRRQVNDANILGECRKREFFISKSEKRKEKRQKRLMAIRKAQREARRAEYRERVLFNSIQESMTPTLKAESPVEPIVQPAAAPVSSITKPAYYSYRKTTAKKTEEGK